MKTQHTPGPWRKSNANPWIYGGNGEYIALVESQGKEADSANARLIAAAPDLLSVLQQAYNAMAWDIPGGGLSDQEEEELLETIRAAIAKAEGAQ